MDIIGIPFGYLIDILYNLTGNFGYTLIIFTLITRVVIFPFSYISHKNSVTLFKIQPQLNDIKAYHSGDTEVLLREQKALYKKEKYSTGKGLLPLILQIIIVLGVVGAVNTAIADGRYDFAFIGLDLATVPSLTGIYAVFPVLSAISAFSLCFLQNYVNPLTRTQGFLGRWGTAIFLTLFSGYFALVCQAGVGFYWIAGNIFSIGVTIICVLIYNPKKYVDITNIVVKTKPGRAEMQAQKEQKKQEKIREKEDTARFYAADKKLVFYSEASGFYKYFAHYIEYILDNSDITVHYVTSDIKDQVFSIKHPRFETYYCGANGLITLMMKMDADVVVMTLPDLGKYHIKRSLVNKNIEYIYTDHGFGSVNVTLKTGALNYYDTIFCFGKTYNEEIRATEKIYNLPQKKLVNVGYGLIDKLIDEYTELEKTASNNSKPQILIAPSWQRDNLLDLCLDEMLAELLTDRYKVILRPHPEFIKRFPEKMKRIFDKYNNRIGENFEIQVDFSSNSTVYLSDIVITDWSSIAQEFSFITKKPSLFINTPMKVMNPQWEDIGIEPIEIMLRKTIGSSVDLDKINTINTVIDKLLSESDNYRDVISQVTEECIYNLGSSAKVGGEYIIERVRQRNIFDSNTIIC